MTDKSLSELIAYIKEQLAQGLSREGMQRILLDAGWSQEQVAEAWRQILSGVTEGSPVAKLQDEVAQLRREIQEIRQMLSVQPRVAAPPAANPFAPSSPRTVEQRREQETAVTGRTFATIGIIALLFGISYFLKYAFDHNLINLSARVILGFCTGLLAVLGADMLSHRKTYRQYAYFLSGGGIAITYLSLYFGYSVYGLFGQGVALAGMLLVTAAALGLAMRSSEHVMASTALLGGFIVPFLTYGGFEDYTIVSVYGFALLFIGLLIESLRKWPVPALMSVFGMYVLQLAWILRAGEAFSFGTPATVLFVIFMTVLAWRLRASVGSEQADDPVLASGIVNSAAFTVLMIAVLAMEELSDLHGTLLFSLAVLHGLIGFLMASRPKSDRRDTDAWVLTALVLAFFAVPVQLDAIWVTIGWLALAAATMGAGISADIASARRISIPVFFLSIGKVFLYDSSSFSEISRIISFLFLGVLLLAMSFFWYRNKERIKQFLS